MTPASGPHHLVAAPRPGDRLPAGAAEAEPDAVRAHVVRVRAARARRARAAGLRAAVLRCVPADLLGPAE